MPGPPSSFWVTLDLDPGTASFFGLPERLTVPSDPEDLLSPSGDGRIPIAKLARALERMAESYPDAADRGNVRAFLKRWPRYADLDRYLAIGNDTFAEAVARELLDRDPDNPPALAALGFLRSRAADWTQAADLHRRGLDRSPSHAPTRLHLALALAGSGQVAEGLDTLAPLSDHPRYHALARLWRHEIATTTAEELPDRLALSLRVFQSISEMEDPESRWKVLQDAFPDNPEILYARAVQPGSMEDAQRERLLRRSLERDADHPLATAALGTLLRQSDRTQEALDAIDRALARNPHNAWVLAGRAQALEQLGRREEVFEAYRAVFQEPLSLLPAPALVIAGQGVLRLSAPHEARALFEDVLEARPGEALPHQLLASLDEAAAGKPAAERRLREALRAAGPHPSLHFALGDLLRRMGRRVEAEGLFRALAKRHPGSPLGHRGLGDLIVHEQPAKAIEHYAKAAERDPLTPIPGFDYLRGIAALRSADATLARRFLERAVAGEPDNPRAWCDLGACQFYTGDIEGALRSTQRALDLSPGNPGFLHNLAMYHRDRFRRNPLRHLSSLWKSRKILRKIPEGENEAWRRDLWRAP